MYNFTKEWFEENNIHEGSIWDRGEFMIISFNSIGCKFKKAGHCIMCNYGRDERNVTYEEAVDTIKKAFERRGSIPEKLLIGTSGSILDEDEMDHGTLVKVLMYIAETKVCDVYIETHYSTVTAENLALIKGILGYKNVIIEMGLESADPKVCHDILNKSMDLDKLHDTIQLIHQYGMDASLNILLGAPGLTITEQLKDTLKTADWAYDHGADEIVVFPVNIKKGTEIHAMYERGEYKPVSSWLLIELLNRMPDDCLSIISVSWYGDRQDAGLLQDSIAPIMCESCRLKLMHFYYRFMKLWSKRTRRMLLADLCDSATCNCRKQIVDNIKEDEL